MSCLISEQGESQKSQDRSRLARPDARLETRYLSPKLQSRLGGPEYWWLDGRPWVSLTTAKNARPMQVQRARSDGA